MRDHRRHTLQVGDRVRVGGGYDEKPAWLAANDGGYDGRVIDLVAQEGHQPAVVVELDEVLVLPDGAGQLRGDELSGRYLRLQLRHTNADWAGGGAPVHVVLYDEWPPASERGPADGVWVETHASCHLHD